MFRILVSSRTGFKLERIGRYDETVSIEDAVKRLLVILEKLPVEVRAQVANVTIDRRSEDGSRPV